MNTNFQESTELKHELFDRNIFVRDHE